MELSGSFLRCMRYLLTKGYYIQQTESGIFVVTEKHARAFLISENAFSQLLPYLVCQNHSGPGNYIYLLPPKDSTERIGLENI
jgi:hypothetical protein